MNPKPKGSNRRRFLEETGAGFGALALHCLSPRLFGSTPTRVDASNPSKTKSPPLVAKAKSVIVLFMVGGPSQIDTFDYKPLLNKLHGKPVPDTIKKAVLATRHANVFHGCKDEIMKSPFKFAQHGQSGLWVSDLYPQVAKFADELCVLHSLQAESNNHAPASYQFHTGDVRPGKASLGSWVTYGLGTENSNLPGYVMLFEAGPLGGAANYSNGFLPASFQPTRFRDEGSPVLDLIPPKQFQIGQRKSLDLLNQLNHDHLNSRRVHSELEARIESYELSYRMQAAALEVGGIESESQSVRDSYGLNHSDKQVVNFGRKCIMARRLVERGVRFVQVYNMFDKDGWDAHANLGKNHVPLARQTDQPTAALLADLKQRGLLDSTLVIWVSEFGRTPMMQGDLGRQHNAAGFTIWMAGGGVRPGVRIGATDELGLMAVKDPQSFKNLHATILKALGIAHEDLTFAINGRHERLTGIAGGATVIPGMLTA